MSFSENWHAALDLQVGGPNKKQIKKKKEKEKDKEKEKKTRRNDY